MPTTFAQIETLARLRLVEITPRFWSSAELLEISIAGSRDLWRDVVDLKQEYYLKVDDKNVFLAANSSELSGVPTDVHKIYLIEPRDITETSSTRGIIFKPLDFNHASFQSARARVATTPEHTVIWYAITGQGAPVNAPIIRVAPQVSSLLNVTLSYVPTLGDMNSNSIVPVPGEVDNALVAWTVAFARAKEKEDRSPDANWLSIYATEKAHLLHSLGLRQLQEPTYVEAMFSEYWP